MWHHDKFSFSVDDNSKNISNHIIMFKTGSTRKYHPALCTILLFLSLLLPKFTGVCYWAQTKLYKHCQKYSSPQKNLFLLDHILLRNPWAWIYISSSIQIIFHNNTHTMTKPPYLISDIQLWRVKHFNTLLKLAITFYILLSYHAMRSIFNIFLTHSMTLQCK